MTAGDVIQSRGKLKRTLMVVLTDKMRKGRYLFIVIIVFCAFSSVSFGTK